MDRQLPPLTALTGARFLAALAVLLAHYQYAGAASLPDWTARLGLGGAGVQFFFVLSGFVLTYNYANTFRNRLRARDLHAFAIARLARLYPIYLLTLLISLLTAAAIGRTVPVSTILINVLALQPFVIDASVQNAINAPSWSIGAEMFFYALFPFVIWVAGSWALSPRKLLVIAAVLIALRLVIDEVFSNTVLPGLQGDSLYHARLWIDRFPPFRLFDFLVGCCVAQYFSHHRSHNSNLLLLLAILGYIAVEWVRFAFGSATFPRASLMLPLFCFGIYALACGGTFLARALSTSSMRLLGEASYSLYLIHWSPLLLLHAFHGRGGSPLWAVVLTMLLCIAVSIALYRYVERPARDLLRSRLLTPAVEPPPYTDGRSAKVP